IVADLPPRKELKGERAFISSASDLEMINRSFNRKEIITAIVHIHHPDRAANGPASVRCRRRRAGSRCNCFSDFQRLWVWRSAPTLPLVSPPQYSQWFFA